MKNHGVAPVEVACACSQETHRRHDFNHHSHASGQATTQRLPTHSLCVCFFQRWNLDATGAHPWPYVSRDYSPELQGMLAVHKWGLVCVLEIPWDSGMLHVRGFGWQVDCLPKG